MADANTTKQATQNASGLEEDSPDAAVVAEKPEWVLEDFGLQQCMYGG